MPYTIKPELRPAVGSLCERIFDKLTLAIREDGRFRCDLANCGGHIEVTRVRLTKAKEYCGQHAGPCQVNRFVQRKRKVMTYLEFDDWIAFHGVVNDVLDKLKVEADVFTRPLETRGKMFVRRVRLGRRVVYDYDVVDVSYGREVHAWNLGTPDQFAGDKP